MIEAFQSRKPWATAILALLLGPAIGMCYLNQGLLAILYFVASMLCRAIPFLIAKSLTISPVDAGMLIAACVHLGGSAHCIWIASKGYYALPFRWYARWYALILIAVLPIIAAIGFRSAYEPFHIPGASMSPNVNAGDYVFIRKFNYLPIQRGDVLVFRNPQKDSAEYIKRVIGLPGDTIQLQNSMLYINGVEVPRTAIGSEAIQSLKEQYTTTRYEETLPEGRKIQILDEATHAPADNTPAYNVPAGHYFMMGDNRDRAADSRHLDAVGYVPAENITGKASVILWNSQTQKLGWSPVQ